MFLLAEASTHSLSGIANSIKTNDKVDFEFQKIKPGIYRRTLREISDNAFETAIIDCALLQQCSCTMGSKFDRYYEPKKIFRTQIFT